MPVYDQPLLYEIAFQSRDAVAQCDFIESVATDAARGRIGRVLEIGCGTGDHLLEMARRGHRVFGLDSSPAMIRHAASRLRAEGFRARLWVDDMTRFSAPARADVAMTWSSTLNLLTTPRRLRSHLGAVGRAVRPGGVYIVDLDHPREQARWGTSGTSRWVERRRGLRVEVDWDHERGFDEKRGVWNGVARLGVRDTKTGLTRDYFQREAVRIYALSEMIGLVADQGDFEITRAHGDYDDRCPFDESDRSWRMILTLRRKAD